MNLIPLNLHFGSKITNFEIENINEQTLIDLKNALYKYKVLIIKNQNPDAKSFIQLARQLGTVQQFPLKDYHHPEFPEILISSNMKDNGKSLGVNRVGTFWHSDSSYLKTPLHITMLMSIVIPQIGGETTFCDMEHAFSSLSDTLKNKIINKYGVHEIKWRYKPTATDLGKSIYEIMETIEKKIPAVIHPLIIKHPVTKKNILYANPGYTSLILDSGYEESKEILNQLFTHSIALENTYTHKWESEDILIWDNRSLLHMAKDFPSEQERMMYRIGVEENMPFYCSHNNA